MEQFPPLLMRAFGERWWETGGLSTYFRNATTDGEPVRAFVTLPHETESSEHVDVWMEDERGGLVLEGSASVGDVRTPSLIERKIREKRQAGERRILANIAVGATCEPVTVRMKQSQIAPRLAVITEPLGWYENPSPWGGPIAHPGFVVHMATSVQPTLLKISGRAVGLYGAIEVRHYRGPVFTDREYTVTGEVLSVGDSPKSEYVWYESVLHEGGERIARMIMQLRFMKASSPLWTD